MHSIRRTEDFARPLPARRAAPSLGRPSPRRPQRDLSAVTDEPVILNPRTGRRRGTAEFLGRDEEPPTTSLSNPFRSRDDVPGALADTENGFGATRVCLLETTPVRATTNHETCRRSANASPRFDLMNQAG